MKVICTFYFSLKLVTALVLSSCYLLTIVYLVCTLILYYYPYFCGLETTRHISSFAYYQFEKQIRQIYNIFRPSSCLFLSFSLKFLCHFSYKSVRVAQLVKDRTKAVGSSPNYRCVMVFVAKYVLYRLCFKQRFCELHVFAKNRSSVTYSSQKGQDN